ncbi:MAG: hypothetical protein K2R93_07935 [Gemmatimonadaceae bacterium]|nr:hypothetical protein [Gemmatimonadaceae bacterium]
MTALEAGSVELARFAVRPEWFVCGMHAGMHCIQAWAPAERIVEHLHALAAHLASVDDDTVDVFVHDHRSARRWAGARIPLTDVRDAVSRIRLPLAAYGEVELSMATATDQLVLAPALLLVVYATTPRWPFLCEALGLVQRDTVPAPTWGTVADHAAQSRPGDADARTPLVAALESFAERLGLMAVVE